jgi:starvation-inducible DNA-binding protein
LELHTLFDGQYNWLRENIDLLAERIRALDFFVSLHYTQLTEASCLSLEDDDVDSAGEMLDNLIAGHQQLLTLLRVGVEKTSELKDYSTADLLTEILREHEKQLWILRSQRAL